MVTVTATEFKTLINDSEIADATAESILDAAIDAINIYYRNGLSNLTGVAGSKTLTVTSQQRGSIMIVARTVYATVYKNAAGATVNVAVVGTAFSDPNVLSTAKNVANQLIGRGFDRV